MVQSAGIAPIAAAATAAAHNERACWTSRCMRRMNHPFGDSSTVQKPSRPRYLTYSESVRNLVAFMWMCCLSWMYSLYTLCASMRTFGCLRTLNALIHATGCAGGSTRLQKYVQSRALRRAAAAPCRWRTHDCATVASVSALVAMHRCTGMRTPSSDAPRTIDGTLLSTHPSPCLDSARRPPSAAGGCLS